MNYRNPTDYPDDDYREDPYEILGVNRTDPIEKIKQVFNLLSKKLHPDRPLTATAIKEGWTKEEKNKAFIRLTSAFKEIMAEKDIERMYPDYQMNYDITGDISIPRNTKIENTEQLNAEFERAKRYDMENGFVDPNDFGYSQFAPNEDEYKQILDHGLSRADINVVGIEQKQRELSGDGSLVHNDYFSFQNCYDKGSSIYATELGLNNISDYSITLNQNARDSLHGSDLMAVYGNNYEYWEDSVKRDSDLYKKYTDETRVDKKLTNYMKEYNSFDSGRRDPAILREMEQRTLEQQLIEDARKNIQLTRDAYYNKKFLNFNQ